MHEDHGASNFDQFPAGPLRFLASG